MLLKAPTLQKGVDHDRVAKDHNEQWKEEAHADLQGQHQDLSSVFYVVPVDKNTRRMPIVVGFHLGEDQFWEGQEYGDKPDQQADIFAVEQPLLLQVLSLGNLYNSNVAVHTNASEQEHAAEEVNPIDGSHHFAGNNTIFPVFNGHRGPEGQRAQEEEVSHSQVQQVHICHRFQAFTHCGVDQNHQQVPNGAEDKDGPEERRFILPFESPSQALVTYAFGRLSMIVIVVILQTKSNYPMSGFHNTSLS